MKSHFTFTKKQRNGILLLLGVIVVLQCIYFYVDFSSQDIKVNQDELLAFEKEFDSLKAIKLEASKPKMYSFNPNYITDFKGETLGMSTEEIDRLLAYRKQGKRINSPEEFQKVTQISDSLFNAIAPYFKFPDWVKESKSSKINKNNYPQSKTFAQKGDLNKATVQELQTVNGLNTYYAKRIVRFRNTFPGGFIADVQLNDVYGLSPEMITKIKQQFTVKTPRKITKININTATVEELVTVQHVDYDLAYKIIEQRKLLQGFNSLNQLKKVNGFPVNKFEIIKLYLLFEKELHE